MKKNLKKAIDHLHLGNQFILDGEKVEWQGWTNDRETIMSFEYDNGKSRVMKLTLFEDKVYNGEIEIVL